MYSNEYKSNILSFLKALWQIYFSLDTLEIKYISLCFEEKQQLQTRHMMRYDEMRDVRVNAYVSKIIFIFAVSNGG